MGKIGIISLNFQVYTVNYGCTLQSYALCRKVREMGYDAETVDYRSCTRDWMNPKFPFWNKRYPLFSSRDRVRNFMYLINGFCGWRKWRNLIKFFSKYGCVSDKKYATATFENSDYQSYIVGSDTIWDIRQMRGFEPAFFGRFNCMKNVIAYAPSFGEAVYDDQESRCLQSYAKKFVALSVREPVNMEAFGSLRDKVSVVLDPTMLYSGQDYAKIAQHPGGRRPYLLYYVVYGANPSVTRRVDEYAISKGLDVIELSIFKQNAHPRFWRFVLRVAHTLKLIHKNSNWLDGGGLIGHRMMYGAGTEEFLGLVQNAEMVVTNSFHGSVFAILFGRKFYNFARSDASAKIKWICSMLGLEGRTLKPNEALSDEPIDYENKVFPRLAKLRESSERFLKNALERCSKA